MAPETIQVPVFDFVSASTFVASEPLSLITPVILLPVLVPPSVAVVVVPVPTLSPTVSEAEVSGADVGLRMALPVSVVAPKLRP